MSGIIPWIPPKPPPPPPSPLPAPPPIQVVAGIDPNELANATYGQQIPIVAFGKVRMGGRIIFGPYIDSGAATFAVSLGMPANPSGTRVLYEIALDSKLVWESSAGTATISSGTFLAETFTARFYQGTQTQAVDPLESAQFGNEAIAYRPHMVIFFDHLPLAPFNNKVPWVAALIGDTTDAADPDDGITLGTAIDRIAKSPWVGHTSATFETSGVNDVVDGVIIADDADFISHLRNLNRFYRNFGIVQSDKLYVIDRGSTITPDIMLTRDHICSGPVTFQLDAPTSIPRELELITIDPDADYSLVPSKAQFPNHPVAVSASVQRESVQLPIVVNASTRTSLATFAKHAEETARKKVNFRAMAYGMEIEPMAFVGLPALADGLDNEVVKVLESTLNGDWTLYILAEAIMRCSFEEAGEPASFIVCGQSEGVATTATFTGVNFGEEHVNRRMIVGLNTKGSPMPSATMTIGGVAATSVAGVSNGDVISSEIFIAHVPTGTSGDVVVTYSGNKQWSAIGVERTVMGSSTPHDTSTVASGILPASIATTIDVENGGVIVCAVAGQVDWPPPSPSSHVGVTRQCKWRGSGTPTLGGSTFSDHVATADETGRAITVEASGSLRATMAVASFSP